MPFEDYHPVYVDVRQDGDVVTAAFTLSHLTDDENVEQLGHELFTLIDQHGCRKLIVDLGKVEYVTSSVLGKLITLHRRMHRHDGKLMLCSVNDTMHEILSTSRLLNYFNVANDAAAAMGVLRDTQVSQEG